MEHVIAETLADRIDDIERIDRMIASAEQRRSAMLREIDRHRASDMRDAIEIKPQGAEKLALILSDASAELARMDRYERRALWRRKLAIREFDAAQAAAAEERA
jgi:hypothetical protein